MLIIPFNGEDTLKFSQSSMLIKIALSMTYPDSR